MSQTKRGQTEEESPLKAQLAAIELKLRKVELWTKSIGVAGATIGIVLTVLNVWNLVQRNNLLSLQVGELAAKREVNVALNLEPQFLSKDRRKFTVAAKFKNSSSRQISIPLLGLRFWKEWSEGTTVNDGQSRLLFSDNRVTKCPKEICPKKGRNYNLVEMEGEIVLPAGEGTYVRIFGPYEVQQSDASEGFWLEGLAYTKEQDNGNCAIAGPPVADGGLPVFCSEEKLQQRDCYKQNDCKRAHAQAQFYQFTP